jgi:hypothetical protein
MMKHTLLFATVVLMLVTVGRGAEPWKTKPVKEWNREETQDFLRSSPWVKQVSTVSLVDLTPSLGNTETTEGRGESSGAEQVPSTETIEAARGRSRLPYFIEWSSAKVVRQANWHIEALLGQAVNQDVEPPPLPVYVLTVRGVYLAAFANLSKAEVMKGASLRLKHAKTSLEAADAMVRKTPKGKVLAVQFAFPRVLDGKPTIPEQEKSVEFICKAGGLNLKVDFNPAKMTTGNGRDL